MIYTIYTFSIPNTCAIYHVYCISIYPTHLLHSAILLLANPHADIHTHSYAECSILNHNALPPSMYVICDLAHAFSTLQYGSDRRVYIPERQPVPSSSTNTDLCKQTPASSTIT